MSMNHYLYIFLLNIILQLFYARCKKKTTSTFHTDVQVSEWRPQIHFSIFNWWASNFKAGTTLGWFEDPWRKGLLRVCWKCLEGRNYLVESPSKGGTTGLVWGPMNKGTTFFKSLEGRDYYGLVWGPLKEGTTLGCFEDPYVGRDYLGFVERKGLL